MVDPRFYSVAGPLTLQELAEISGAETGGATNLETVFRDVAPLDAAGPQDVSFLDNKKYVDVFSKSQAGACLVHPGLAAKAPQEMALLLTEQPYQGYALVARAFYPMVPPEPVISPAASIDETADLGEGCRVDAGAVIAAGAQIGLRCHIGANTVIGENVILGDDCIIGAGASLMFCMVGSRVIVHAGVRIGQDGFGFVPGGDGHTKVMQLGRVIIEDDVEIGANTTIDRGAGPDTVVGAGTKIDNLVQIAHNVRLGRGCFVVSQVGVSGSTTIGDFAMIGGQAGLTGHLHIGDGTRIAAQSGIMRDLEPGATVGGSPAVPMRQWLRGVAIIERMARKKGGG